jgi:hypothetical protein
MGLLPAGADPAPRALGSGKADVKDAEIIEEESDDLSGSDSHGG